MGELTTSSANTSVDLPGTAVDKDRHEDVNDESDDQVNTEINSLVADTEDR